MFEYKIQYPKTNTNKPKALLMLHGYGSNEDDLFSFANQLPDDLLIISARAPYKLPFGGYAWYDIFIDAQNNKVSNNEQANQSLIKLSQFIDFLIDEYNIDKDNFNLLGFSQGAILSYALAFAYPEKIKNVIALSGYINKEIMLENIDNTKYKHLNFYISHGNYDDIIPISEALPTQDYLKKHNIQFVFNRYDMGHEVNFDNFTSLLEWSRRYL